MPGRLVNIADFDNLLTGTDGPHRTAGRLARVYEFPGGKHSDPPAVAEPQRPHRIGWNLSLEIAAALFFYLIWMLWRTYR